MDHLVNHLMNHLMILLQMDSVHFPPFIQDLLKCKPKPDIYDNDYEEKLII